MDHVKRHFDIAVIGGGPGGYPAAIKAAQGGKSVALIEAKEIGGTCLNRGCIPTKTLIASSDLWVKIKKASEFGILVSNPTFEFEKMTNRKNLLVSGIRNSLEGLIASNKITLFKGFGKFHTSKEIKIIGADNLLIEAEKTIVATGSEPRAIEAFPFDYERIHSSTSILDLLVLPKKLLIVGGGVIGCEFASLYSALGVEVTILELMPRILPMECSSVSSFLSDSFKKRGIQVLCGISVEGIERTATGVRAKISGSDPIAADMALVAVGRSLNSSAIGLDKIGVKVEENGLVVVNERMETTVPGIYAVGDIASKWWLAHVATHQGIVAATNAIGGDAVMHYNAIPAVIFTHPEIATVGISLDQALEKGYAAARAAFPFRALGKSQANLETEGFAQIVKDVDSGQILGAQVVGYEAATLIAEMTAAIANELTVDCITETIHAHPTISESWMEAAFLINGTPLHLPPKK